MNSDFIASSPFYYLQKNSDVTRILRIVMRHTGGGLRCKKERYIREGDFPDRRLNIFS